MTTLTSLPSLSDLILATLGRFAPAPTDPVHADPSPHMSRCERRRMILELDPQSCGSEIGAQMLMAQFPRDF